MFILIFLKYFPTDAPVSNDQLTAELIALEQHRCASMVKADIAALQNTLHDQLVYVHSSGVRDRKTSYLNKLSDRKMRYDTLQFTELHVTARYRGGPLCHPHRAHAGQHLPWRQACRAHLTLHGGVGAGKCLQSRAVRWFEPGWQLLPMVLAPGAQQSKALNVNPNSASGCPSAAPRPFVPAPPT